MNSRTKYLSIGGVAAAVNLLLFLGFQVGGFDITTSTASAYILTAAINYYLGMTVNLQRRPRWNSFTQVGAYTVVATACAALDLGMTWVLWDLNYAAWFAKGGASALCFLPLSSCHLLFWKPRRQKVRMYYRGGY
jgi:putative flippase GtrA